MADLFGFRRSGRAVRARVGYWLGGGAKKSAHRARRLSPSGGHHRHGPAGPPARQASSWRSSITAGARGPELNRNQKWLTSRRTQLTCRHHPDRAGLVDLVWLDVSNQNRRQRAQRGCGSNAYHRCGSGAGAVGGRRGRGTEQGRDRRRHRLGGRGPAPWRVGCGVSRGRLRYQDRTVPVFFVKRMSSSRRPRAVAAGQAGHEWVSRSSADRSNPGVSLHETGPELSEHASGHGEKSDKFR